MDRVVGFGEGGKMGGGFEPGVEAPAGVEVEAGWWFVVRGAPAEVLVRAGEGADEIPRVVGLGELGLEAGRRQYLGRLGGVACWSAEVGEGVRAPAGMAFRGLRALHGRVDDLVWTLAGRAAQVTEWDRNHGYCGRCGAGTEAVRGERAKRCPACGLTVYPRISPAVIVLVERGGKALLARGRNFPGDFYGIVAGFVEPGETFEEAVAREVREEVGLELAEIRYFGSQPWPFPHGVMVGFTARWAGGEIRIDETELADARWCGPDELPNLPSKLSIARRLIDDWVERGARGEGGVREEG